MKKVFLFFLWIIFVYIIVAGGAWAWVLGIKYSFWKLLVIAIIQAILLIIQTVLFPSNKKAGNK